MVLARKDIRELIEGQHIKISTFDPRYLKQATYDMRLGSDVFLVSSSTAGTRDLETSRISIVGNGSSRELGHVVDVIGRPNNHSR